MQYDKDMNSPFAELFLKVESFICKKIGDDVKKRYSANITTYFTKLGGYCYLKTYEDRVHIGWFKGSSLDDKYDNLIGDGKVIRGHKIIKLDKLTKEAIKYYIDETTVSLIEQNELKKMRKRR